MKIQDLKNRATILNNQQAKQIKGGNTEPKPTTETVSSIVIVDDHEL
ncbi:MAG: hypothetical protein AAFW73_05725 [Bacteroidota bacterium]